jgi:hypothetical protein
MVKVSASPSGSDADSTSPDSRPTGNERDESAATGGRLIAGVTVTTTSRALL